MQDQLLPTVKHEITNFTLEFVLMHAARNEKVFQAARALLRPEHMGLPGETPHRVIWANLLALYEQTRKRPQHNTLSARVLSEIETTPTAVPEALVNAGDIMAWMYNEQVNPESALEPDEAIAMLREVLMEREAGYRLRRAVADAGGHVLRNLPALIEETRRQVDTISALGRANEDENTMPTSWATGARPCWPTGVSFIDKILEGGSSPGDTNVLIGPTGVGKTTLSMQLCCSIAKLQYQMAQGRIPGEPGLSVFLSYEDGLQMLRVRAASYGAQVLKNRLRRLKSDADLSTRGHLEEYELEMFRGPNIAEQPGEVERLDAARVWLDKYVRLVDFDSSEQGGHGGIQEARYKLEALQDKAGLPIRAVFIDWAGQMVTNQMAAQNRELAQGNMALELRALVGRARDEIAGPYGCTCWIAHQLAGAHLSALPARLPHHSEAESCKTFASNAWYAFCFGTKDQEHNVCQFVATKTRHGESLPPAILKVDGAFCRMVDVSEHFAVDKLTRMIQPKSETDRVVEHVPQQARLSMAGLDSEMTGQI